MNVYYVADWCSRTLLNGDERGFGFNYVVSAENQEEAVKKVDEKFGLVGKVTVTSIDISEPVLVEEAM